MWPGRSSAPGRPSALLAGSALAPVGRPAGGVDEYTEQPLERRRRGIGPLGVALDADDEAAVGRLQPLRLVHRPGCAPGRWRRGRVRGRPVHALVVERVDVTTPPRTFVGERIRARRVPGATRSGWSGAGRRSPSAPPACPSTCWRRVPPENALIAWNPRQIPRIGTSLAGRRLPRLELERVALRLGCACPGTAGRSAPARCRRRRSAGGRPSRRRPRSASPRGTRHLGGQPRRHVAPRAPRIARSSSPRCRVRLAGGVGDGDDDPRAARGRAHRDTIAPGRRRDREAAGLGPASDGPATAAVSAGSRDRRPIGDDLEHPADLQAVRPVRARSGSSDGYVARFQ